MNYNSAIAKAVAWLGDRYLLAKPTNATQARTGRGRSPFMWHRRHLFDKDHRQLQATSNLTR